MFLIGKKELAIQDELKNYTNYGVKYYVSYLNKILNKEDADILESCKKDYTQAIELFTLAFDEYYNLDLLDSLSFDDIENDNYPQVNKENIIDKIPLSLKNFFKTPIIPELIYLSNSEYSTHFHLKDGVVIEAEHIEVLPGLDKSLKIPKINKIFDNLTIKEARNLLKQMNILPKDNGIDYILDICDSFKELQRIFYRNILIKLLSSEDPIEGLKQAMIFANLFGVTYDFEPRLNEIRKLNSRKLKPSHS